MFFRYTLQKQKRKEISSLPGINLSSNLCSGRTSLFIFRRFEFFKKISRNQKEKGLLNASLTLEAACVLPLFLFAIIMVFYFMKAVAVAGDVAEGMQEAGKTMAVYGYARKTLGEEPATELLTGGFTAVYAKQRIAEKMKENPLGKGIVKNKDNGISFMRSSFFRENEMIDLVATYQLEFPIPFFSIRNLDILQRVRVRAWTGRCAGNAGESEEANEEQVYITTNGTVYHKERECTHIRLSIQMVDSQRLKTLRNKSGGKYYPCEECGGGEGDIYITDTGDRYHCSVNCSGLKRGVIAVPISQVETWTPCSRCGG